MADETRGGSEVEESAAKVKEAAREQSRAVLEEAKQRGLGIFEEQRGVFARHVEHWSGAMRSAADNLEQQGEQTAGHYARWSADGLHRVARNLDTADPQQLLGRVTDFARRRPALFLGSAIVAGLAVSQFMRPARSHPEGAAAGEREPSPEATSGRAGLHPRPEAEYGELETRKPGSPNA